MRWFSLILVILLSGCDQAPKDIQNTAFELRLILVDEIVQDGVYRGGLQQSSADGSVCWVTLVRDEYPRCLQHEVRHCIEGDYHVGYDSYQDCFD